MNLNKAFEYYTKRVNTYLSYFSLKNYEVFIEIDKKPAIGGAVHSGMIPVKWYI